MDCQFKFTCWVLSTGAGICIHAWRCLYSLLDFFSLTKLRIKCNPQSKHLCIESFCCWMKVLFHALTVQSDYGTLSLSGGNHCKNNIITICVLSRDFISEHLAFQESYRCCYCIIHLVRDCHSCVHSCILFQTIWQQTLIWASAGYVLQFSWVLFWYIGIVPGKLTSLKKQSKILSLYMVSFRSPVMI